MSRNNTKRLGSPSVNIRTDEGTPNPPATVGNLIGDISLVVPTQIVELPSKGKFYAQDSTLFQRETVEIKALTAREEDILSSTEYIKSGIVFDKLLESIIIDKSINHRELLSGDKNAILIAARISGYGPQYTVTKTCPHCGEEGEFEYDLNIAKPKEVDLESADLEYRDGLFWIHLPKSNVKAGIRLMNGQDLKVLETQREKKQKLSLESTQLLDFLRHVLVEAGGSRDPNLLNQFIDIMPAGDSRKIRKTYNDVMPDLDTKQSLVCSACSREHESEVWFALNFFWPDT